jgi:hypothetical protein
MRDSTLRREYVAGTNQGCFALQFFFLFLVFVLVRALGVDFSDSDMACWFRGVLRGRKMSSEMGFIAFHPDDEAAACWRTRIREANNRTVSSPGEARKLRMGLG